MKGYLIGVTLLCARLVAVSAKNEKKSDDKEDYGTVIGIDLGTTYSW